MAAPIINEITQFVCQF